MKNTREELVKLLEKTVFANPSFFSYEAIADAIIEDGWIKPPVEAGQTVYVVEERHAKIITPYVVQRVLIQKRGTRIRIKSTKGDDILDIFEEDIDKYVFLTENEAKDSLEVYA